MVFKTLAIAGLKVHSHMGVLMSALALIMVLATLVLDGFKVVSVTRLGLEGQVVNVLVDSRVE